jgi:hypothetical protein
MMITSAAETGRHFTTALYTDARRESTILVDNRPSAQQPRNGNCPGGCRLPTANSRPPKMELTPKMKPAKPAPHFPGIVVRSRVEVPMSWPLPPRSPPSIQGPLASPPLACWGGRAASAAGPGARSVSADCPKRCRIACAPSALPAAPPMPWNQHRCRPEAKLRDLAHSTGVHKNGIPGGMGNFTPIIGPECPKPSTCLNADPQSKPVKASPLPVTLRPVAPAHLPPVVRNRRPVF